MSDLLENLIIENKRLLKHNRIIATQLSIAIEGLEALVSIGDIAGIPQKTLSAMEKCEKESLQDNSENE